MQTETRETTSYIPFDRIRTAEQPYAFRFPNDALVSAIKESLVRTGQETPITLLETSQGDYVVLDGHRRVEAIQRIHEEGGFWEKVLAHVHPENSLSAKDRVHILWNKNENDGPYKLVEQARLIRCFDLMGVSMMELALATGFSAQKLRDLLSLASAATELADLIHENELDAALAVMLHRTYEVWSLSEYAPQALPTVHKILNHAKSEKVTPKSWRFLIDFYWTDRPFMVPAPRA